jgi:hypothetical protein
MANRTFTLHEAQVLLPVLEGLLKTAMEGKRTIDAIDEEFQQLNQRIFLNGGTLVPVVSMAARKGEKEETAQRVKDALAEIEATGAQVKDLDMGLLDFPCVLEDRVILLCWKLGEKSISHWHGTDEGYKFRKPIDDAILRASKPKNPN